VLLLLLLLLGELECVVVRDLTLHLSKGLVGELLLGLDHAQVDILLMGCGNLLLLLLKEFNLLGESELLHCATVSKKVMTDERDGGARRRMGRQRTHQRGELRRATSVCDVEATTARAGRAILSVLIHWSLDLEGE
jgi:hypothetical protein